MTVAPSMKSIIFCQFHTHTHTQHNHFTALWTLSGTTRVSRYQKVHFAIFWIFWSKMKITQTDAPTVWMDCHHIQTNWYPHLCHPPPFLRRMPFLTQPSQFILAWDRHQICWLAYPVAVNFNAFNFVWGFRPFTSMFLYRLCVTVSVHFSKPWDHCIHTHNRFTALWILSGTTRVSRYQKKHSSTHLSWSSITPYLLHPSTTIHGILPVQSTYLTVFFHNHSPKFLWSTSWPGTLHFILHTFLHPIIVFFSQHMPNLFHCSTEIMSSYPSLSVNVLLGIVL